MGIKLVPDPVVRLPGDDSQKIELSRPSTEPAKSIGFGEILQSAVDEVVQSQNRADTLINEFITGGDVEIHEAIIAAEQANLTLTLAIQIRNKAMESFQELFRIQV